MLCRECKKRDKCKNLCQKAKQFVNQDYASQRETPYSPITTFKAHQNSPLDNIFFFISKWPTNEVGGYFQEDEVNFPFLTLLQNKCLHLYYFEGLTYKRIASRLSSANQYGVFVRLTSEGVSYQLRSAKRQILQKYHRTKNGDSYE